MIRSNKILLVFIAFHYLNCEFKLPSQDLQLLLIKDLIRISSTNLLDMKNKSKLYSYDEYLKSLDLIYKEFKDIFDVLKTQDNICIKNKNQYDKNCLQFNAKIKEYDYIKNKLNTKNINFRLPITAHESLTNTINLDKYLFERMSKFLIFNKNYVHFKDRDDFFSKNSNIYIKIKIAINTFLRLKFNMIKHKVYTVLQTQGEALVSLYNTTFKKHENKILQMTKDNTLYGNNIESFKQLKEYVENSRMIRIINKSKNQSNNQSEYHEILHRLYSKYIRFIRLLYKKSERDYINKLPKQCQLSENKKLYLSAVNNLLPIKYCINTDLFNPIPQLDVKSIDDFFENSYAQDLKEYIFINKNPLNKDDYSNEFSNINKVARIINLYDKDINEYIEHNNKAYTDTKHKNITSINLNYMKIKMYIQGMIKKLNHIAHLIKNDYKDIFKLKYEKDFIKNYPILRVILKTRSKN